MMVKENYILDVFFLTVKLVIETSYQNYLISLRVQILKLI